MEKRRQVIESYHAPINTTVLWLDSNDDSFKRYDNGEWIALKGYDNNSSNKLPDNQTLYLNKANDPIYLETFLKNFNHSESGYLVDKDNNIYPMIIGSMNEGLINLCLVEHHFKNYYCYCILPDENPEDNSPIPNSYSIKFEGWASTLISVNFDNNTIQFLPNTIFLNTNSLSDLNFKWVFFSGSDDSTAILMFLGMLAQYGMIEYLFSRALCQGSMFQGQMSPIYGGVVESATLRGYSNSIRLYVRVMNALYKIDTTTVNNEEQQILNMEWEVVTSNIE